MIKNYYEKEKEEIFEELKTRELGLSEEEVNKRIELYGKNKIPEQKKSSPILIFLKQFISPIIIVLLVAMVLCLIVGELSNAIFIFAVVTINSIIGSMQEISAEKSASKLQNMIKIKTKVIRDGKKIEINSEDLTIGDIVVLESGDKISADIRIIKSSSLQVDESILTGESLPVLKNAKKIVGKKAISEVSCVCYAGCVVTSGRGVGVVYAIGLETEFGKIALNILERKTTASPLIIRMNKFIKQITQLFAIFAVVVSLILYFKGYIIREIFFLIISLTVSAIPEGLSIAMTVALSKSSSRMALKNVIVKKLNAVESLGSCTVIASDKTGTLTLNQQTAKVIKLVGANIINVSGSGYNDEGEILFDSIENKQNVLKICKLGVLNNEAVLKKEDGVFVKYGDSIDASFLSLGLKANITTNDVEILGTIPYESEAKYSAVFYKEDIIYHTVKGSTEKVLEFCTKMIQDGKEVLVDKDLILEENKELASEGYRVIALAYGSVKDFTRKEEYNSSDISNLTFLGLVGFIDPIREDTIEAIKTCKDAGIKTVMITGDHPLTAYKIAKELNMLETIDEVVTGSSLQEISSSEDFDKIVSQTKVFARVTPLQKLEIVDSFKRLGEFVAVTGDGVNDSPALKSASIGIAMGSGTDIAKETGNMIITDDDFSSIVEGVKEGRIAYSNIRNVIYLLLSSGFSEIVLFLLAIILNLPTPMIAVQLLWLNLITNGIQDVALSFEKGENFVMKQKPRSPKEGIFNKQMIQQIFISAFLIGIIAFVVYYLLINTFNVEVKRARTYILLLMIFMENMHIFNCRSEYTSMFKLPLKNNLFVVTSLIACIIFQVIFTLFDNPFARILDLDPLPFINILLIFTLTFPVIIVMEIFKKIKRNKELL